MCNQFLQHFSTKILETSWTQYIPFPGVHLLLHKYVRVLEYFVQIRDLYTTVEVVHLLLEKSNKMTYVRNSTYGHNGTGYCQPLNLVEYVAQV